MKDVAGCSEEERHGEYYDMPWTQEAVYRYFYSKVGGITDCGHIYYVCLVAQVQQKRGELEKALGIRNT
jgi:SWI/SNF-related matrix-associated actin-dependent regulator of chromatin subfamily D